MKNSGDNVFRRSSVGPEETSLLLAYLDGHDFAANSRRAIIQDLGSSPLGSPAPMPNRSVSAE